MDTLYRIRDVRAALLALERDFEQEYEVSFNEAMVLCGLRRNERMSSGEIGELIGQTRSNASKIIASVERKGLIKRGIGDDDKRRMYFAMTDRGRKLIEAVEGADETLEDRLKEVLKK